MEIIILIIILCIVVVGGCLFYKLLHDNQNRLYSMEQATQKLLKQEEHSQETVVRMDERFKTIYQGLDYLARTQGEASTQVNLIAQRVNALNDIMVNKKSRGNWGEYQLSHLLSVYVGDNQNIFETQYSLKNGTIADVALHLPGDNKVMVIDSKFPLENYQQLTHQDLSVQETIRYETEFKKNIKKHIDDISKKYITQETVDNAVMFIPSEAIYMFICSQYSELIEYAHKKHVLMTCPTTLIGVVFTLVNITKDFQRNKHIKQLEQDIIRMQEDAQRLTDRLNRLNNQIETLQKTNILVNKSAEKIVNKIQKIHDGANIEDE